ncbi:hypothetical protein VCRA2116O28_100118 [Vibrio crassostreae]|nr:hypothetical protein VCRA2116O28_100118 [Vibrio crassostreae]CAK1703812.1 hypothetical protein VCRA2116O27_100118 [Vibrio crassostreae]CAK1721950.1 hypothetical protein VCRA2116O26_110115 [Vibrio crassostreae]CAK1731571.1 hypothetical protein VCRA2119O47_120042 [Vibrio crassostreae]CAK1740602.1 hypothetical protein VCRA2113O22_120115 [Vibrio crassostreae]
MRLGCLNLIQCFKRSINLMLKMQEMFIDAEINITIRFSCVIFRTVLIKTE